MIKLIKRNSRIFILITALITLVMIVSFSALYFVLPDFYLYTKTKKLETDSQILAENLKQAQSREECIDLIRGFSLQNNSNVIPYHDDDTIIIDLFSPLIMVENSAKYNVVIRGDDAYQSVSLQKTETGIESTRGGIKIALSESDAEPAGTAEAVKANRVQSIYVTKDTDSLAVIKKDVSSEFINYIEIMSVFQPIDEAKNVMLNLMPFLLIIDILIALTAAFVYLKKVEQYEQRKTDFMRAASHELKTPIAALNGILEGMIDNVGVYKDKEKYLQESKNLVEKLAGLVGEILNASKDEKPVIEDIKIGVLINEALVRHQVLIEEKELNVIFEAVYKCAEDGFDFICKTDKKLLLVAISNLISNAVHYTDRNGKVYVRFKDGILSIENECENIEEEKLAKLFEPFYTLNDSRDKLQSGTGLGLYIVKRHMEALKMRYKIENTHLGIKFSIFF